MALFLQLGEEIDTFGTWEDNVKYLPSPRRNLSAVKHNEKVISHLLALTEVVHNKVNQWLHPNTKINNKPKATNFGPNDKGTYKNQQNQLDANFHDKYIEPINSRAKKLPAAAKSRPWLP